MKQTILFIAPHLSTGGMPQYLYKQIEAINNFANVYCIEWENITGGKLVVQRNRVAQLLGSRLITLHSDKQELLQHIQRIKPDVIHLQEIPELFMSVEVADQLYSPQRSYVIIETSHDSSYNTNNKAYLPDKFLMVSKYQMQQYERLGIPCDIVEYPIEYKVRTKTREQALSNLGLDPNLKHVINVGLFTPRKNQAEILEYARMLVNYPIHFHFIGNQADNFKHYWEPLMQNFPSNCTWWGERDDVDKFYEAADLFLFTSKGTGTDHETMPLVIREALSWNTPSMIYNLPVYMGYFNQYDTIEYLTNDIRENSYRIAEKLLTNQPTISVPNDTECIVITSYPNTTSMVELTKECIGYAKQFKLPIILTSHCAIPDELQKLVDYCIVDTNNLLTRHTHYSVSWYDHSDYYASINLKGENNDTYHGPAVHTNYYNGIALAKGLGFTKAYCWNYDVWAKDTQFINKMRNALTSHSMVTHQYREEEGLCVKTVLFGTDTTFFMEQFPKITTEQEYSAWMNRVESESNGLENIWYHTVKHQLNKVRAWSTEEYQEITRYNQMDMCSMVEYYTVLPIENDTTHAMIWFSSRNTTDSRTLRIFVNDEVVNTMQILNASQYYTPINLSTTNTVIFEVSDTITGNIINKKVVEVTQENISKNGIFKHKNK